MERGAKALQRRGNFDPFLYGDALTLADIVFLFSFPMAANVARTVLDWDLAAEMPHAEALIARLKTRETVQKVDANAVIGMQEFRDYYGIK
jgi:glutathione S-transferase